MKANLKINLVIKSAEYQNIDAKLIKTENELVIKDEDGRLYRLPDKIDYDSGKVNTSSLFSDEDISYGDYKYIFHIEGVLGFWGF